uniref:Transmembrane protein n=1 Tax=Neospora caninum (strain Liverpool) TaxID=572307 RepID=A0A0F7UKX8_NEOCL|nr:TPA: hypothetical protein BN1204_048870 [Neospora caninum Liverpool]
MGLLAPDVLCTLLVVFFIFRVGSFLHLWRLWTSGLAIPVGVAPSTRKGPGGRGDKKEGAAVRTVSLWPVARLAGLGVLDGFQELRDASNFLLTSLGCTAAVALLQLFKYGASPGVRTPSPASRAGASLPTSPEGYPGGMAPLPLLIVAFFAFVRMQWITHRRFLAARRQLPLGHRTATGFFVGGAVALALVTDIFGVTQRFEFASLLPAYFRELWNPLVDSAVFCDSAFDRQRLAFLERVWPFFLFGVKAAFVAFLAFEGSVLAAPVQVETNLIAVALYKPDYVQPGTEDVVQRLQVPFVHLERVAIPLLIVLPFLWMPGVYASFLAETSLSSLGFGGLRLFLACVAALLLLRRAKLATQVSAVLAVSSKESAQTEDRPQTEEKKAAKSSATGAPSSAPVSSPASPSPAVHPSRSLLFRLLDLLGLPARLLLLVAFSSLLLLLQAQHGRDSPFLPSGSVVSTSGVRNAAPSLETPNAPLFSAPAPASASSCSASRRPEEAGQGASGSESCAPSPHASEAWPPSRDSTPDSSPSAATVGPEGKRKTTAEPGDGRSEKNPTCALLWIFLGNADQRRLALQTLGGVSLREKILWIRRAARVLPFNSPSFAPFLQQLSNVVLVGTLATAAFLFSLASNEVRRRGLQRLSIWDIQAS